MKNVKKSDTSSVQHKSSLFQLTPIVIPDLSTGTQDARMDFTQNGCNYGRKCLQKYNQIFRFL